jgi:hypothetical protein
MDTGKHQLEQLFAQLGLDNDVTAIKVFLARHWLEPEQALAEAPFWSVAQADFLRQALACDAEWAEAVDELAALLSQK